MSPREGAVCQGSTDPTGLTLVLAGDLYIDRPSPGDVFAEVVQLWRDADVVFGNLEAPLSTRGEVLRGRAWPLRSAPGVAALLADAGFTVVSTAHNHAWDFGEQALRDTWSHLDAAGVAHAGSGGDVGAARAPVVLGTAGPSVAVLARACAALPESAAGEGRLGVARIDVRATTALDTEMQREHPGYPPQVVTEVEPAALEGVTSDIETACRAGHLVVLSVHWGLPFSDAVLAYQIQLAHAAIDAGAMAVVGHHSHVVQRVEFYRGRPILYGLGQLVFDLDYPGGFAEHQALARLRIAPGGQSVELDLLPVHVPAGGRPRPALEAAAIEALAGAVAGAGVRLGRPDTAGWMRTGPSSLPTG